MATHSSMLAWRIPWTEEPGRLHGVTRVGHDLATFIYYTITTTTTHSSMLAWRIPWTEAAVHGSQNAFIY